MATNEIEIEVTLDAKDAERGLDRLEKGGEAVGETFNSVGKSVSTLGGEMNEKLGAVGESVGGLTESMMGLSSAVMNSGGSFLALVGPIGAVAVALFEAVSAFNEYSGKTREVEMRTEAYAAASSELVGVIDQLAAGQVNLTREQVNHLRVLTQQAAMSGEMAQQVNQQNRETFRQIELSGIRIENLRKEIRETQELSRANVQAGYALSALQAQLNAETARRAQLQAKLAKEEARVTDLALERGRKQMAVEQEVEKRLKTGEIAQKERAKQEAALLEQARIQELQRNKESAQAQTKIAVIESQKRQRELREVENIGEDVRAKAILAEQQALLAKLKEIRSADAKRRRSEAQKAAQMRQVAIAKRIAQEKIAQAELARIRRAEIENMRITGADQLELLERQQALELELAGNNARAREAITLEFENRRLAIQQEAERKRQEEARKAAEEERRRDEQRQAFILDNLEFDLRMQSEGIDKELALLELRYRREMEIRGRSEEEITELTRRYHAERTRLVEDNANQGYVAVLESLSDIKEEVLRSTAEISYDLLTSVKQDSREAFKALDEEFKKEEERIKQSSEEAAIIQEQMTMLTSNYAKEREKIRQAEKGAPSRMIGELLTALGKQAAVEALMFTAKGVAAAFVDPGAAGGYFAAAGIMGTAAGVAGYAGAQLSESAGAAYGGGSISPEAPTSPTGSPQSAPAPERERAESTAMVFNINFGNSTIYDTKRAAQDAMASEIMRTINRQRRGAPRFAMG